MSDSAQIPSPSVSSYVDSYVPPGMQASVPSQTSTVAAPLSSSPVAKQDTVPAVDPLKQLEELVQEYESKKIEKEKEDISALRDLESLAAQSSGKKKSESGEHKDPLAELEKVLEEYEKKYQAQSQESTAVQQPLSQDSVSSSTQPLATAMSQTVAPDLGITEGSQKSDSETPKMPEAGESIDEQNIFELLGVKTATDSEKETFLDELQQALWEDFLDKDMPLLVTEKELVEIRAVQNDVNLLEEKKQNTLIEKIEKLVPDIEDIMLEKALELKEDMVWERVKGMKEHFVGKPDALSKITQAESHLKAGRWKSGTGLLNSLME